MTSGSMGQPSINFSSGYKHMHTRTCLDVFYTPYQRVCTVLCHTTKAKLAYDYVAKYLNYYWKQYQRKNVSHRLGQDNNMASIQC